MHILLSEASMQAAGIRIHNKKNKDPIDHAKYISK
jgi:hypothetical protein